MKVTLLAGGTGGTKLAHGFTLLDPPVELTVIANIGDDFELHGLHVSPDIDAVLYTLGGLIDTDRGWGIRDDLAEASASSRPPSRTTAARNRGGTSRSGRSSRSPKSCGHSLASGSGT